MLRISSSLAEITSKKPPSWATLIDPLIWADPFLCNPITERLVTVFPEPDSPTMATVSP